MKKSSYRLLWIYFIALVCAGMGGQAGMTVYDDFTSGSLSNWTFTSGTPQRTDAAVTNGMLAWGSSERPGYGLETLVSTKNDFVLKASRKNPLMIQIDLKGLIQKKGAGYDTFGMGWKDQNGNRLVARLYFGADGAANESVYRFYYNGDQLGTADSANLALAANDIFKFKYDGEKLYLLRNRDGRESILYSLAWNNAKFFGVGSVYLETTLQGSGGKVVLDNVSAQGSEAE